MEEVETTESTTQDGPKAVQQAQESPKGGAEAAAQEAVKDAKQDNAKSTPLENAKAPHMGSHYHQKKLQQLAKSTDAQPTDAEGERTVYVANLDWSVDEARLHKVFSGVDGLKEVRLVKDFLQRSKGYAYIDYETSQQVDEAVQKFNGKEVNKRPLKVARSKPTKGLFEEKTLFVSKLAPAADEAMLRAVFAAKGEILDVRMPKESASDAHKGYAYVEYADNSSIASALALDGTEIAGQAVQVARSIPMKEHRHQTAPPRKDLPARSNQRSIIERKLEQRDPVKQASKCPTTVYVKNLAFGVDDEALQKHFEIHGDVEQVLICRNNKGKSQGFGFVEFATEASAQDALALTSSVLQGREIVVSKSQRAITVKKAKPEQTVNDEAAAATEPAPSAEKAVAPSGAFAEPPRPPRVKRRLNLDDTSEAQGGPAAKVAKTAADKDEGNADQDSEAKQVAHVPFRVAKAPKLGGAAGESAVTDKMDDTSTADPMPVAKEPPRPMSNADFRALLLKG